MRSRVRRPAIGTSTTSQADVFSYVAAPYVNGVNASWGGTDGNNVVTISGSDLDGATAGTACRLAAPVSEFEDGKR